jgi:heptosyltransferase-2
MKTGPSLFFFLSVRSLYICAVSARYLIIQTAFIGDVVLATALIESLAHAHPDAEIDFLLRKGNEALLTGHPKLKELLVWDKKNGKYRNLWQILGRIRERKYDAVINVQRFAATGFLTAFSGAREKIGFQKNPWSFLFTKRVHHTVSTPENPLHETGRNQLLIEHLAGFKPPKPKLYPSAADEALVDPLKSSPYICMAPASVWFTKQFPEDQWVSLIKAIPADLKIYLLGGPGDRELCNRILERAGSPDRVENFCGKLGFLASAALQRDARMSYVNDSAPMHFSSAVNGPVTAIYCSTMPSFGFGPLSERSFIVEVEEQLSCRPCGLHGQRTCPQGHFNCAKKIRTAQLLETLG